MLTIARLDTAITYLVLAFAAVMGFSRGGIHTVAWLLIVATVIRYCWRPFPIPLDRDLTRAMLIFFGALAMSTAFSGDIAASLKFLGLTVVKVLPFFIIVAVVKERNITEQATVLIAGSMLVGAAIAIWQGLHGVGRANSMLGIMDFAGIIGLVVPVLLVKGFDEKTGKAVRLLFITAAFAAMVALLFNGTRAVWVSVFVTCVIFIVFNIFVNGRQSLKAPLFIIAVLVGMSVLVLSYGKFEARFESIFTTNLSSNHKRLVLWEYAWKVFNSHPLLGVGLATIPPYSFTPTEALQLQSYPTYGHVHNNFLQIMAENGLVGLIGFIFLFFTIAKTALLKLKAPQTRSWAIIALLCTIDFLLHGMFDYTFSIATIMYSYWFILGLAYVNFADPALKQ